MPKSRKKYSGVIVPMITPFTAGGGIDFQAVERIVNNFIANDVFPMVLGTTGETASIHDDDKIRLIQFIAQKFGEKTPIYAAISENCFRKSVDLAKQYFQFGIELIVALLPGYYPLNRQQIRKHFTDLADSIPGKLFVYNIPATTHISIPLDILDDLSYHEKIVGVKDSERDLARLDRSIKMWRDRDDFSHFIGWGAQCFEGLWKGSDGIVPSTGNFCPAVYKSMYDAVQHENKANGQILQNISMEVSAIYQDNKILSESLAALKSMMQAAGLCGKTVLPPLTEVTGLEEIEILNQTQKIIKKYNFSWI